MIRRLLEGYGLWVKVNVQDWIMATGLDGKVAS
jgi:hypothetical protein